jgi:hypothetical protein
MNTNLSNFKADLTAKFFCFIYHFEAATETEWKRHNDQHIRDEYEKASAAAMRRLLLSL